jgi:hypothetical protein
MLLTTADETLMLRSPMGRQSRRKPERRGDSPTGEIQKHG